MNAYVMLSLLGNYQVEKFFLPDNCRVKTA